MTKLYLCWKNFIKTIIFFNLIFLDQKLVLYPSKLNPFYLSDNKPILLIDPSKKETLLKGRNYLDRCLNFSNECNYTYIQQPKVSAIIPLYNCEKTIMPAINSIQYQNMSEIEIILVNDFSKDNTYKIIRNYQRMDERIKIINNRKNMGTVFKINCCLNIKRRIYFWFR